MITDVNNKTTVKVKKVKIKEFSIIPEKHRSRVPEKRRSGVSEFRRNCM